MYHNQFLIHKMIIFNRNISKKSSINFVLFYAIKNKYNTQIK
jgi:hypothetical protein